MNLLDEFFESHPHEIGWVSDKQAIKKQLMEKELEINALISEVSNKFINWSFAKDHFISEEVNYLLDLHHKLIAGEMNEVDIIYAMNKEIESLKKQSGAMDSESVRQVIIVKPRNITVKNDEVYVDLIIAGIGFVSGGLQVAAGMALIDTGIGAGFGALLLAHGANNVIENGYFLLYRENYVGPVKFAYEGIGSHLGISQKNAHVVYSFVDIALSVNGLVGFTLESDMARLYRYVNADLLWGLKERGIKMMSTGDLVLELISDINTIIGQKRSY